MSKSDHSDYAATTKVVIKESWTGTLEEESLKAFSENRHRGCRRDMLAQTVPSTGSSNRESPIADSGQLCMTDTQQQEEEEHVLLWTSNEIVCTLEPISEV